MAKNCDYADEEREQRIEQRRLERDEELIKYFPKEFESICGLVKCVRLCNYYNAEYGFYPCRRNVEEYCLKESFAKLDRERQELYDEKIAKNLWSFWE